MHPAVWLTLSDDLAFFAAETEFAHHTVRCIDVITQVTPRSEPSLFDDVIEDAPQVYILPVKTASALDKIVAAPPAPLICIIENYGVLKPYQLKAPPHVRIFDEMRAKSHIPRTFQVLHSLKREAFCVALRTLPALRDYVDMHNTPPTANNVRDALTPDEVTQVYPTPLPAGLLSGDDYGTLCFETEKTWSAYQKNSADAGLLVRGQRLSHAKIRCKQGNERPFVV